MEQDFLPGDVFGVANSYCRIPQAEDDHRVCQHLGSVVEARHREECPDARTCPFPCADCPGLSRNPNPKLHRIGADLLQTKF